MVGFFEIPADLGGDGAEILHGAMVTQGYFATLGAQPVLGRDFVRGEDEVGRHQVAILSHELWSRRFGARPEVLGTKIRVNEQDYQVVGVAPAGLRASLLQPVDLWLPMPGQPGANDRGHGYLRVLGRLQPGMTPLEAKAELSLLGSRLATQHDTELQGVGITMEPLLESLVGTRRPWLRALALAATFLLLLTGLNVANLCLARLSSRDQEHSLRLALGAGRWQFSRRQPLGEVLLLSAAGGAEGLGLGRLVLSPTRFPGDAELADFLARVESELARVPAVERAATASSVPLATGGSDYPFSLERRAASPGEAETSLVRSVSASYFETLGVPRISGRGFSLGDSAAADPVVLVSQAFAGRFLPGQSPLGRRLKIHGTRGEPWRAIVGVVGSARSAALHEPATPEIFVPVAQMPSRIVYVLARSAAAPEAIAIHIRDAVRRAESLQAVGALTMVETKIAEKLAPRRFSAGLIASFAAAAVFLALVGIYGLLTVLVSQERPSLAIRLALGAPANILRRHILLKSVYLAVTGVALGTLVSWLLSRGLSSLLYGVSATSPGAFVFAALVVVVAAVLAAWLPAARAAGVDPPEALKGTE